MSGHRRALAPILRGAVLAAMLAVSACGAFAGSHFDDVQGAIVRGDVAAVKSLVTNSTQANEWESPESPSFLVTAVKHDRVEIVAALLEKYANVDAPDGSGTTPLMWAASEGHARIAEMLLHHYATRDAHDATGESALDLARKNRHADVVAVLMKDEAEEKTSAAATPANPDGATRYVWAVQGLNLRAGPLPTSAVLRKLPYGTPVSLLAQEGAPVPYAVTYIPKSDGNDIWTKHPPLVLNGAWVKVRCGDQDGYVVDRLVLAYPPFTRDKDTRQADDYDLPVGFDEYLLRAFKLGPARITKLKLGDQSYAVDATYPSHPDGKLRLVIEQYYDEDGGGYGRDLFLQGVPFEEALVFINAVLPPKSDTAMPYIYKPGVEFRYGDGTTLTQEKNGIRFRWERGPG